MQVELLKLIGHAPHSAEKPAADAIAINPPQEPMVVAIHADCKVRCSSSLCTVLVKTDLTTTFTGLLLDQCTLQIRQPHVFVLLCVQQIAQVCKMQDMLVPPSTSCWHVPAC